MGLVFNCYLTVILTSINSPGFIQINITAKDAASVINQKLNSNVNNLTAGVNCSLSLEMLSDYNLWL